MYYIAVTVWEGVLAKYLKYHKAGCSQKHPSPEAFEAA